jgi:hypothetical protein
MILVYGPKTREEIDGMGRESLLSRIRSKGYGVAEDLSRAGLIARAEEFWGCCRCIGHC